MPVIDESSSTVVWSSNMECCYDSSFSEDFLEMQKGHFISQDDNNFVTPFRSGFLCIWWVWSSGALRRAMKDLNLKVPTVLQLRHGGLVSTALGANSTGSMGLKLVPQVIFTLFHLPSFLLSFFNPTPPPLPPPPQALKTTPAI